MLLTLSFWNGCVFHFEKVFKNRKGMFENKKPDLHTKMQIRLYILRGLIYTVILYSSILR